jgi:hypothetical protein
VPQNRKLPRPFSLHFGDGHIVEEASFEGPYHNPAIQLLAFNEGTEALRFCYYSHDGRFQRSPLILGDDTIEGMRQAIARNPRLKALLTALTAE